MKMILAALMLISSFAFAQEHVSPGFRGTLPEPPIPYPTRLQALAAILGHPKLAELLQKADKPEEGYVLQNVSMQYAKGETHPKQVNLQLGRSNAKWHGTLMLCARFEYTGIPEVLADGTMPVKISQTYAYIHFTGGGCD